MSRGELIFISLFFWEPLIKFLRPLRALSLDLLSSAVSCYRQWRHGNLLYGQLFSLMLFGYSYKLHLDLLKHCFVHNIYHKWLFLCVEPKYKRQRVIMSCHNVPQWWLNKYIHQCIKVFILLFSIVKHAFMCRSFPHSPIDKPYINPFTSVWVMPQLDSMSRERNRTAITGVH